MRTRARTAAVRFRVRVRVSGTDSRPSFQVDENDDLFCCPCFCSRPYPARSQSVGGVIHSESLNYDKYRDDLKCSPEDAVVMEFVSKEAMIIIATRRTSTSTVSRSTMSQRFIVSFSTSSESSGALGTYTTIRS